MQQFYTGAVMRIPSSMVTSLMTWDVKVHRYTYYYYALTDHYAEMESNRSRMSVSSIPELLQEGWAFHLRPAGRLSYAIRPDGTRI